MQIVRYRTNTQTSWGVHKDGLISPLKGDYQTTADFVTKGGLEEAKTAKLGTLAIDGVEVLSPVTSDGDYICSGYELR